MGQNRQAATNAVTIFVYARSWLAVLHWVFLDDWLYIMAGTEDHARYAAVAGIASLCAANSAIQKRNESQFSAAGW